MRNPERILGKRNVMKFYRADAMRGIYNHAMREKKAAAQCDRNSSCILHLAKGLWRDKKGMRVSFFSAQFILAVEVSFPFLSLSLFFFYFFSFSLAQFPSPSSKSRRWLCAPVAPFFSSSIDLAEISKGLKRR